MNKRADSRLLSPWLFFILIIIGIGIIVGVLIFYNTKADIRKEEAAAIANNIMDGIASNGYLNQEVFSSDFFVLTGLNPEMFVDGRDFYFNLTIYGNGRPVEFSNGTRDFQYQCEIPGNNFAKCYEKEGILLSRTNPDMIYRIKLLTASNQKQK